MPYQNRTTPRHTEGPVLRQNNLQWSQNVLQKQQVTEMLFNKSCSDTVWEINVADLNRLVSLSGITVIPSHLCVGAKRPETSTHTLTASVWTSPAYVSVCFGSIGVLHVDTFAAQRVWALTLVVLILFPDEHIHPELSGRVLHSSPSRHGSISHHHFPITMDAAEGEHRPIDKKKKKRSKSGTKTDTYVLDMGDMDLKIRTIYCFFFR